MKLRFPACFLFLSFLFCILPASYAAEADGASPLPRIAFFLKEGEQWEEQDSTCFLLPDERVPILCYYLPLEGDPIPLEMTSGDPAVASVENGLLTAGSKEGQTSLTAIYQNIKFTLRVTVSLHAGESDQLQCDSLSIDREKGLVTLPNAGFTVSSLKQLFRGLGEISFLDPSGVKIESGKIGTGCEIRLVRRGVVKDRLTFFLQGDINGDGAISRKDTELLTQALLQKAALSPLQQSAADCDKDGQVDSVDLYRIALLILDSGND